MSNDKFKFIKAITTLVHFCDMYFFTNPKHQLPQMVLPSSLFAVPSKTYILHILYLLCLWVWLVDKQLFYQVTQEMDASPTVAHYRIKLNQTTSTEWMAVKLAVVERQGRVSARKRSSRGC